MLKGSKSLKKGKSFSKPSLAVFILLFAAVGGVVLFLSLAAPNPNLKGDLNNDGKVDGGDLSVLATYWHTNNSNGDITGDNYVDVADLAQVMLNWGRTTSNDTTPITFGRTTVGANAGTMTGDFKRGTLFNLTSPSTINSVSAYLDGNGGVGGSQSLRYAIYGSDSNSKPAGLLAQTGVININSGQAAGWVSANLTSPVNLAAGNYFLTIHSGSTEGVAQLYFDGSGNSPYGPADTFSDGPSDPWGVPGGQDDRQISIQATGTTAGGSGGGGGGGGGGGTASIFISPGGSDGNACTSSAPCQSFAKAYSKAAAGSIVQVAPGNYPTQTLSTNNPLLTSSSPVTFQPPSGSSRSAVTVADLELTGSNNINFKTMTFGLGAQATYIWNQTFSSNTVCDDCYIHGGFTIQDQAANVTFKNGEIGNYVSDNADPEIGCRHGPTVTNCVQPGPIYFINENWHDIDSSSTAPHTECLQLLAVHGLTIQHSKMYNCNIHGNGSKADIMFSGFDHAQGCYSEATCGTNNDYWNILIENNFLSAGTTGNQFAFNIDGQTWSTNCPGGGTCTDSFDLKNVVIQYNNIIGYGLFSTVAADVNPISNLIVRANIFSFSSGFLECNAVFSYNVNEAGSNCSGTNQLNNSPQTYVNRAALDLHLVGGDSAIGHGDLANKPTTGDDIDSQTRPIGAIDAGADEL